MTIESLFLETSVATLRKLTGRIEVCLGKLSDDQIWARGHETENAVGNLVLHLCGNVRQWIISGLGGKPDVRVRDREFSARGGVTAAELSTRIRETVEDAARVISTLTSEQLMRNHSIQNRQPSGLEAVYHVVEHFGEHTGQILYATKMLTGEDLGFYRNLSTSSARP